MGRENISECSFLPLWRSVYMPSVEIQEYPVLEDTQGQTNRHIPNHLLNPFKGGGSTIPYTCTRTV